MDKAFQAFALKERVTLHTAVNRFHLHAHEYSCQISYNPMQQPAIFGMTDGESVETVWSSNSHLVRITRRVMEILGRQEVKTRRLPTAYDNYRKLVKARRGEHGYFVGPETGFSCLSQEERDRYEPTLDQLREAQQILRLEDLKSNLRSIMEELEATYGVFAFAVASGPIQSKESVYFASPSAQPFVEYDYYRMQNVVRDDRNMFYRWNVFLHSRDSFFVSIENGPLPTEPVPSADSGARSQATLTEPYKGKTSRVFDLRASLCPTVSSTCPVKAGR
ncbi:hypothetical protein V1525DRAFT_397425 [Lipomyces kononenkoae]|uniref:Uncharacterized protein n=1 Tax=Lipomyces kononenkoae TaxID=34357 RepID=A0ACC3T6Y8_LIPKO